MSNPNKKGQAKLFYDGPLSPEDREELARRQRLEDLEDEEQEAAGLKLTPELYERYKSILKDPNKNVVQAWMIVTGGTEQEYNNLPINQKRVVEKRALKEESQREVTLEDLAKIRPSWIKDSWMGKNHRNSPSQSPDAIRFNRSEEMQRLIDYNPQRDGEFDPEGLSDPESATSDQG